MQQIYTPKQDYKVLVRCFTYNQSKYIEDALNGFAMQQTNFPFVCLVMDDCSTDGEQEVIKAYLDRECDMKRAEYFEDDTTTMTLVPHRTNVNCTFAVYLLKKNLYRVEEAKMVYVNPWREHCEYEALCEGDDYWTDPYKLQKQVDYMVSHQELGLCYTDYSRYYNETKQMQKACFASGMHRSIDFEDHLLNKGYIAPMTWLYRTNLLNEIKNEKGFIDGTFAMALECYQKNWVGYVPDDTAVHVVHMGSACHQTDVRKQFAYEYNVFLEQVYYAEKYQLYDLARQVKFDNYLQLLPKAKMVQNENFICEASSFFRTLNIDLNQYIKYVEYINYCINDSKHVRDSYSYKIGHVLLRPYQFLKRIRQNKSES